MPVKVIALSIPEKLRAKIGQLVGQLDSKAAVAGSDPLSFEDAKALVHLVDELAEWAEKNAEQVARIGSEMNALESLLAQSGAKPGSAAGKMLEARLAATAKLVAAVDDRLCTVEDAVVQLAKRPMIKVDPLNPERKKLDAIKAEFDVIVGKSLGAN
jgi:hypothetical protein